MASHGDLICEMFLFFFLQCFSQIVLDCDCCIDVSPLYILCFKLEINYRIFRPNKTCYKNSHVDIPHPLTKWCQLVKKVQNTLQEADKALLLHCLLGQTDSAGNLGQLSVSDK